ncbi:hypothetical protein EYF80_007904 [Liparis tanakae]|uniref:Uncharacterized protein n=1 Tax=Liparis tanakae TaxID=230148 RepID=A0A4Z2IV09_9TELE|nr:hypothetical protein EYF80_007904 [Liparis tanakae]
MKRSSSSISCERVLPASDDADATDEFSITTGANQHMTSSLRTTNNHERDRFASVSNSRSVLCGAEQTQERPLLSPGSRRGAGCIEANKSATRCKLAEHRTTRAVRSVRNPNDIIIHIESKHWFCVFIIVRTQSPNLPEVVATRALLSHWALTYSVRGLQLEESRFASERRDITKFKMIT